VWFFFPLNQTSIYQAQTFFSHLAYLVGFRARLFLVPPAALSWFTLNLSISKPCAFAFILWVGALILCYFLSFILITSFFFILSFGGLFELVLEGASIVGATTTSCCVVLHQFNHVYALLKSTQKQAKITSLTFVENDDWV